MPKQYVTDMLNFVTARCAHKYPTGYKPTHFDNPVADGVDPHTFVPFAHALKTSGVLDALIGPKAYLRLPPGCRAVYPNHPEGLGAAHQDGGRLTDMDTFVTVWVPLVEIDEKCGGLGFYSSLGLPTAALPEGNHGIDMGTAIPTPIHMSPGDVLIFHKYMPHISMPNTSDRVRYSLDLRFCSSIERIKKEVIDLQEWSYVDRRQA